MLTARLSIDTRLGQLQVKPARLDLRIQSVSPIQGSQISVSGHQFQISWAEPTEIAINTRAIQSELGFLRSQEFAQKARQEAEASASSGVSKIVSEGYQYLNSPQNATGAIAKNSGIYSANVEIGSVPKNRPEVTVSEPGEVTSQFIKGSVDVQVNSDVEIIPDSEPIQIRLDTPPKLTISVKPMATPKLNIDLIA